MKESNLLVTIWETVFGAVSLNPVKSNRKFKPENVENEPMSLEESDDDDVIYQPNCSRLDLGIPFKIVEWTFIRWNSLTKSITVCN